MNPAARRVFFLLAALAAAAPPAGGPLLAQDAPAPAAPDAGAAQPAPPADSPAPDAPKKAPADECPLVAGSPLYYNIIYALSDDVLHLFPNEIPTTVKGKQQEGLFASEGGRKLQEKLQKVKSDWLSRTWVAEVTTLEISNNDAAEERRMKITFPSLSQKDNGYVIPVTTYDHQAARAERSHGRLCNEIGGFYVSSLRTDFRPLDIGTRHYFQSALLISMTPDETAALEKKRVRMSASNIAVMLSFRLTGELKDIPHESKMRKVPVAGNVTLRLVHRISKEVLYEAGY